MLLTSQINPNITTQMPDGRWVLALPLPLYGLRPWLRDVWAVATGKARAIKEG